MRIDALEQHWGKTVHSADSPFAELVEYEPRDTPHVRRAIAAVLISGDVDVRSPDQHRRILISIGISTDPELGVAHPKEGDRFLLRHKKGSALWVFELMSIDETSDAGRWNLNLEGRSYA